MEKSIPVYNNTSALTFLTLSLNTEENNEPNSAGIPKCCSAVLKASSLLASASSGSSASKSISSGLSSVEGGTKLYL